MISIAIGFFCAGFAIGSLFIIAVVAVSQLV